MKSIDIWVTSDSHYNHVNLVKGVSTWDDKTQCRDFSTVKEMNDALVDGINKNVKPDDHLYHVGDFAFGRGPENIIEFRSRIKCKNIWLFTGNHDHRLKSSKSDLLYLFNKVRAKASMRVADQDVTFNHFPELIWDKHHHGAWHLYGHCHNSLNGKGFLNKFFLDRKCMDVGVDTHPEFRPYNWDEIKAIMDRKKIVFLDHHTSER